MEWPELTLIVRTLTCLGGFECMGVTRQRVILVYKTYLIAVLDKYFRERICGSLTVRTIKIRELNNFNRRIFRSANRVFRQDLDLLPRWLKRDHDVVRRLSTQFVHIGM